MNQTAAAATQNGFPPRDGTLRRLTVHTDSVRADLVLPDWLPLASLLPTLVDITSGSRPYEPGPTAVRYQLAVPGNAPLEQSKTLAQLAVRDGAVLILTCSSTELPAPRLDDVAEAVHGSVIGMQRRWTPRVRRVGGTLAAGLFAAVSAAMLIRTALALAGIRSACIAAAAIACLTGLLAAAAAHRGYQQQATAATLGIIGCGFAAVAGFLIIPCPLGPPQALLAASAAAASAGIVRVIRCCTTIFTALTCFAVIEAVAAAVASATTMSLHAVGAASAAVSLILAETAAPMSIMLTGLSPEQQTDGVEATAMRARRRLVGMVNAFSASAALGAVGAAVGQRLAGITFAALIGAVLLSRAGAHQALAISLPLIVFGTLTVVIALVDAAMVYPTQAPCVAAASLGLAGLALWLGFIDHPAKLSPTGRRSIELLEYLAVAAVLPLACWTGGLDAAARGLNLL